MFYSLCVCGVGRGSVGGSRNWQRKAKHNETINNKLFSSLPSEVKVTRSILVCNHGLKKVLVPSCSDNSLMEEHEKEQLERKEIENVFSLPEIQVWGENYSDFVKL